MNDADPDEESKFAFVLVFMPRDLDLASWKLMLEETFRVPRSDVL